MASIEKNLNTSVPAGVVGLSRTGIKPWSLSNMDDSNHKTLGTPGVAVPSNGYDQTAKVPVTENFGNQVDGSVGRILTDNTQNSVTTNAHPNGVDNPGNAAGFSGSFSDNYVEGAVNTRLDVNGPALTGQGADVATYGPNPITTSAQPGYSIKGD